MAVGTISSSVDAVGVAVVNYKIPICESYDEVLANASRIAGMVDGVKMGYPGLDLVIFPEYSTNGFHPTKWRDYTTTLDGPEVATFAEACKRNKVFGVFSLTGEKHPEGKNPYNTMVMLNDQGEIAMVYRKIFPWMPVEPWTAGNETVVAEGPKGLKVGGVICYDGNFPEVVRDTVMKGAELIIRIQGYPYPAWEQTKFVNQTRAWENLAYLACANLTGSNGVYSFYGKSGIVDFDGRYMAEASNGADEVIYATLPLGALRDARRNWTSENHLYDLVHRGYVANPGGGQTTMPFDFYKTWATDPEKARAIVHGLSRAKDEPSGI
jgi:amidase